jgi:hypothetical protein
MGGVFQTCKTNWKIGNAYKTVFLKPEGKKPLGKRRLRRESNTLIELSTSKKYGFQVTIWMGFI